jgi:uncharacterized membrane protein YcaP (DUF421 family)
LIFLAATSDKIFNLEELLLGNEPAGFLLEVVFRSFVMFIVVLCTLRILGKRGVHQLSVFELVIILTLGSAGGDPMFYKDVGLLPPILVFLMITILYRAAIELAEKNRKFERFIESRPSCIIEDGRVLIENLKPEPLTHDDLFTELRMEGVSQLGQLRRAYLEPSGELSVFFFPDDQVKSGLPIFPELLENKLSTIPHKGEYACMYCTQVEQLKEGNTPECPVCKSNCWVKASDEKRTT